MVGKVDLSLKGVEELLNELLDITKLDAGAMTPVFTGFPIAKLLEAMEVEFAPVAAQRNLRLRVRPSREWVRSDHRLLRRILQNFMSNALRYTRSGGVVVGTRRRGNMLRLEVWDTGAGIPESKLDVIFREFHRLESARNMEAGGLGLGLAIVERMGRALGHPIDVHSRTGRGTVFSVSVPRDDAHAQAAPAPARNPDGRLDGMRVLCIDNEKDILEGMALMIGQWGCTVLTATDAHAARAVIAKADGPPAVMLADYHLAHGMTGIQAMDRLRRDLKTAIPGVVVTADRGPDVAGQTRRHGYALLNKPVRPAKLRALMTGLARPHTSTQDSADAAE